MREITSHRVEEEDKHLYVYAVDERGAGNANHLYGIYLQKNGEIEKLSSIFFQKGPILEEGMNGLTIEALLAICKDRLEGFQSGSFACDSNQVALDNINRALESLHSRTLDRRKRGVEGKSEK